MNDCFENFGNYSNFYACSQPCDEQGMMMNCRNQYLCPPISANLPQYARFNSEMASYAVSDEKLINSSYAPNYPIISKPIRIQEAKSESIMTPLQREIINNRCKASSPVISLIPCMPMSDDEEQDGSINTCKNSLRAKLSFKSKPFVANKNRRCSQDTKAQSDEDGNSSVKSEDINSPNYSALNTVSKFNTNKNRNSDIKNVTANPDENPKASSQMKFKTELCKNWQNGDCKFGSKCMFAHGVEELTEKKHLPQNYKTKVCKQFHEELYCPYGSRCQFIHLEETDKSQDSALRSAIYSLAGLNPSRRVNNSRLSVFKQLAE